MKTKNLFLIPALIAGLGLIPAGRVTAQTFRTLHSFTATAYNDNPDYAGYTLQSAPAITGTFTNLPAVTSPYTNPITGPQQFFRLSQ